MSVMQMKETASLFQAIYAYLYSDAATPPMPLLLRPYRDVHKLVGIELTVLSFT